MGNPTANDIGPLLSQQLLLSVAEELKLPLLQIARQVEQLCLTGQADLATVQSMADNALRLLDNYTLGVRLSLEPTRLANEPVSISAILYDSAHKLAALAKSYGVTLDVDFAAHLEPVIAHRRGLEAALVSLGASLIEALPAQEKTQLKLSIASHRSRYGIVAGLYCSNPSLSSEVLSRGRRLQRHSRQPFLNISHTPGAGIFVADALMGAMQLRLRVSRHHRLYGLGTVLQSNPQLQLI